MAEIMERMRAATTRAIKETLRRSIRDASKSPPR